jgi:hypothetical protein
VGWEEFVLGLFFNSCWWVTGFPEGVVMIWFWLQFYILFGGTLWFEAELFS